MKNCVFVQTQFELKYVSLIFDFFCSSIVQYGRATQCVIMGQPLAE